MKGETNSIYKESKIAFTVCNLGYLEKALVLANSLHKTNQLKTNIFIFDEQIDLPIFEGHIIITWIKEVASSDFLQHAFKYNVIELTTAYKPYLAKKLIQNYDQVFFFDPDIMFFGSLKCIYEKLTTHDFLLSPHLNSVQWDPSENIHMQRFGFFNLGFFALNKSDISISILDWWWKQCQSHCFDEPHYGMFTDQKWMSLAPFYFPEIGVVNNSELNVAWWNLKERVLTHKDDKFYVNGTPLMFFHFSSFGDRNTLSKRPYHLGYNKSKTLNKLALLYESNLDRLKVNINTKYSFDYFNDGDYINPVLRRAYASCIEDFIELSNPFSKPKKLNVFISKNYLNSRSTVNLSHIGHQQRKDNLKFIIFYSSLVRLVLRIVGPNRFIAFNRLITYSSSLINFKELWRK